MKITITNVDDGGFKLKIKNKYKTSEIVFESWDKTLIRIEDEFKKDTKTKSLSEEINEAGQIMQEEMAKQMFDPIKISKVLVEP